MPFTVKIIGNMPHRNALIEREVLCLGDNIQRVRRVRSVPLPTLMPLSPITSSPNTSWGEASDGVGNRHLRVRNKTFV
jgi:hypothetical protein